MFPHIPSQTIAQDLAITGNVQETCERILSGIVSAPRPPTPPPVVQVKTSPTVDYIPKDNVPDPVKEWAPSSDQRQANLRQRKEYMMQQARK